VSQWGVTESGRECVGRETDRQRQTETDRIRQRQTETKRGCVTSVRDITHVRQHLSPGHAPLSLCTRRTHTLVPGQGGRGLQQVCLERAFHCQGASIHPMHCHSHPHHLALHPPHSHARARPSHAHRRRCCSVSASAAHRVDLLDSSPMPAQSRWQAELGNAGIPLLYLSQATPANHVARKVRAPVDRATPLCPRHPPHPLQHHSTHHLLEARHP